MFDPLLEQDPWIQELNAQNRARGHEEGLIEGELLSSRSILANIVRKRFPSLISFAEAKAAQIGEPDDLKNLITQIAIAGDEQVARKILESLTTS